MTLRPRTVALTVLVALIGIVASWRGFPPFVWQLPAVIVVMLVFAEFGTVRKRALSLVLSQPPQLGLGAEHAASVAITNGGATRCKLRACPVPPPGIATARRDFQRQLAPGESAVHEFTLSGTALGRHEWPHQPVEIRGRYGLADWIRYVPINSVTKVVPNRKLVHVGSHGLAQSGQRRVLKAGSGNEETRGLREYSPGDPPATIDWKATARQRELMVRETTNTEHIEIVVAIDAGQASGLTCGNLTVLGHCANVAARLLATAELRGDRAGLLVFADRVLGSLPAGHGPAHQRRLQELLAATITADAESNPLPAVVALSRLAQRRSLIVLFSQLHDVQASGQLFRAIKLLRPKHLPLVVALRDPAIDMLAGQPASRWLDPYVSLAAIEYRREVRAIAQRLQRLGADIVEAAPDELGAAVMQRYEQLSRLRRV